MIDFDLILDWTLWLFLLSWPAFVFWRFLKINALRVCVAWLSLNIVLFIMTSERVSIYLNYPQKSVPIWLTHGYQWIGTLGDIDASGVLVFLLYHVFFFIYSVLLISKIVLIVRR